MSDVHCCDCGKPTPDDLSKDVNCVTCPDCVEYWHNEKLTGKVRSDHYRQYSEEPLDGTFAVLAEPGYKWADLYATQAGQEPIRVSLSWASARDLGTRLIQWAGNPSLHTLTDQSWDGEQGGAVNIRVTDGEVEIWLTYKDGESKRAWLTHAGALPAIDLGRRLIAWAGA